MIDTMDLYNNVNTTQDYENYASYSPFAFKNKITETQKIDIL